MSNITKFLICSATPNAAVGITPNHRPGLGLTISDYCVPVYDVATRCYLRSAAVHQLTLPSVRSSTFGSRAFASVGPAVWNLLLEYAYLHKLLGTTRLLFFQL